MGKIVLPMLEKGDKLCSFIIEPGERRIIDRVPNLSVGCVRVQRTDDSCYSHIVFPSLSTMSLSSALCSSLRHRDVRGKVVSVLTDDPSKDSKKVLSIDIPVIHESSIKLVDLYATFINVLIRNNESEVKYLNLEDITPPVTLAKEYIDFACELQNDSVDKRVSIINRFKRFREVLDTAKFLNGIQEVGLVENSLSQIQQVIRDMPVKFEDLKRFINLAEENSVRWPTLRTILEVTYSQEEEKFTSQGYYKRHKGN